MLKVFCVGASKSGKSRIAESLVETEKNEENVYKPTLGVDHYEVTLPKQFTETIVGKGQKAKSKKKKKEENLKVNLIELGGSFAANWLSYLNGARNLIYVVSLSEVE